MENPSVIETELDAPFVAAFDLQGVQAPSPAAVDDELLVEEISIDGMCGVY
jgi:mycofactocin precursor